MLSRFSEPWLLPICYSPANFHLWGLTSCKVSCFGFGVLLFRINDALVITGGVPPHLFSGKIQASDGRVPWHIARFCVEKIITRSLWSCRLDVCRLWPRRPLYFTAYGRPVCCRRSSSHSISTSRARREKLGSELCCNFLVW